MGKGADKKGWSPFDKIGSLKEGQFMIAPMRIEDIDRVSELEKQSFSYPWPRDNFREIAFSQTYKAFVARRSSGDILGYVIYYIAAGEAHIMNVVTNPDYRRRGIAQSMLDFVHGLFRKAGIKSTYLELRRSNYPAYRLYKKHGYAYVGLRRGYYADNLEDAILMRKTMV